MAKQRDTFILRYDFLPQIKMLTKEQRGDLLLAIFTHQTNESTPEMDAITQMCFGFIRSSLDLNAERYNAICERNKENGSQGGRPPKPHKKEVKENPITERLKNKPIAKSGLNEKPNENLLNPIDTDTNTDTDSETDSETEENISISAASRKERENFLKVLLFEKNLQDPTKELLRFEAHYQKTGWIDANGNLIRNRLAALKAWTPDKDAIRLSLPSVRWWSKIYERMGGDRLPMLEHFRGIAREGDTLHIMADNKALVGFMESNLEALREVVDRLFEEGLKVNYRVKN